jgi:hypothetical protein
MTKLIKSRKMRWVGHVAYLAQKGNAYRDLLGNAEGKTPLF